MSRKNKHKKLNIDEKIREVENIDLTIKGENENNIGDNTQNIREDLIPDVEEIPTDEEDNNLKRLSLDDISENEEFVKNENYIPPTNPRNTPKKKIYITATSIGAGILALILIFAFVFKGSFNYGADVNRAKKLAHHYIGYDLIHDNQKNTYGYKIDLYNQEGNLTDSLTFANALIRPASELNGIYIYDKDSKEIKLFSPSEEGKFNQTIIIKCPEQITDDVSNFVLNNKYIGFGTKDKITFVLKDKGTIESELNLKDLSLNDAAIEKIFENSIILENKLFFIHGSHLYFYNIEDKKFDDMDFYKENFSMNIADNKLFIGNKFGSSSNKSYIFVIDPNEFIVENVITLNSSTSTILKNASTDECFAVIETNQLESSSKNVFYEVDFKSMKEYELPKEDKDSTNRIEYILANQLYFSNGYMYMSSNYATTTIVKVTDIYTLDQKDITINNDNFIPLIN